MSDSYQFGSRRLAAWLAGAALIGACSSSTPTAEGTKAPSGMGAPPSTTGPNTTMMPPTTGQPPTAGGMDAGVRPGGPPTTVSGSGSAMNPGTTTPGNPPAMPPAQTSASVTQYHNHASRDGLYIDPTFTRAAAKGLHIDAAFAPMVNGAVYAQPLFFDGGGEGKDLVIVATEQNQVSAFKTDGTMAWQKTLDQPSSNLPCGNIRPLGITGTPVIDEASRTLYLDAMTGPSSKHMIHALSLDDGSPRAGWPVDVPAKVQGFESNVQNQRGGLIILNGMVYVPYGGHFGDCGNYNGWVVGVKLDDPNTVLSWKTRSKAAGIWAPGGIASDGKSLYVATGNAMADNGGLFSAPNTYGDGESVIRLPPDLKFSGMDADFAAAMNWQMLDSSDSDVGGSGPMLFSVPGASPSELAIALGKDGQAYLLSAQMLGGLGKFVSTTRVSSEQLINAPVAYTTAGGTFVAFKGTGMNCPMAGGGGRKITAIKIMPGSPPTMAPAWCNGPNGQGSPIVTSTDGMNETIVWYVTAEGDNKLRGFNGETGEVVFDGGGAGEQMGMVNRFQTPIVAKGKVYVAAAGRVYGFTL